MSFGRKALIVFLAVAVVLSLVTAAIWLNAGGAGRSRSEAAGRTTGTPPQVTFAEGARTADAELNTFVHDFVEICLRGDYDRFRLCWTAHSPQIGSSRFRAMWEAAEHIVITKIAPVPGKAQGKAYVVKASVTLSAAKLRSKDAEAQRRDVEVLVLREDGKWVVAPAPRLEPDDKDHFLPATDTAPASQPKASSANRD